MLCCGLAGDTDGVLLNCSLRHLQDTIRVKPEHATRKKRSRRVHKTHRACPGAVKGRLVPCPEDTPGARRHGWSFLAGSRAFWLGEAKNVQKTLMAHMSQFPPFDLQIHQPPTQEKIGIVVEKGAPLLARGTDVDVSVEVAVGTWVACDRVDQALTQQDCLQHRERLLRNKRHSDGFCFYIRNGCNDALLFRPPSRDLEVTSSLIGADFLRGLTTLTNGSSVNVSYHLAVVALGVLLESQLTERGCFLPDPSERPSTDHHS